MLHTRFSGSTGGHRSVFLLRAGAGPAPFEGQPAFWRGWTPAPGQGGSCCCSCSRGPGSRGHLGAVLVRLGLNLVPSVLNPRRCCGFRVGSARYLTEIEPLELALLKSSRGGACPGHPPRARPACVAQQPKLPLRSPGERGLTVEWYRMPHLNPLAL